jgi:integrase
LLLKSRPGRPLDEVPPRSGFLEWNTFTEIRTAMRPHAQIPATIAFWTGMRIGEILSLTWSQLTFDHHRRWVRLQLAGLTKNGRPRQVIMPGDLYETLWNWRQQTRDIACPFVCQYAARRLGSIKRHWESVCVALKLATGEWVKEGRYWRNYEGPLVHDLRRTGVRNLRRAGVDRDTAKSISGHLTDSVFTRYNIVDEEDLAEAGEKVVCYIKARSASTTSSTTSRTMAIEESA